MARKRGGKRGQDDAALAGFRAGVAAISRHPVFAPLAAHTHIVRDEPWRGKNLCPEDGWAVVTTNGYIHVHPTRRGTPEQWVYVLAHCLAHLGFGHVREREHPREWNVACDCFVTRFLATLKLGGPPPELRHLPDPPASTEEALHGAFCRDGIPDDLPRYGVAGPHDDMIMAAERPGWRRDETWEAYFARGLARALASAVNVAAGCEPSLGADQQALTPAVRARNWFVNSYPLLGSLASVFEIVEDPQVCIRTGIMVAAVDALSRELFVNPAAGLGEEECRFVMAHELLHVGLRHHARRQGRDPFLWNVACDYVINGWLPEMGIGQIPPIGALHDPDLKGLSAEAVYDRIVTDMRRYRKLCTLAGAGICDILERGKPKWWARGDGLTLDDLYRRCLGQGLSYHDEESRGFLPAGLVEEIRALSVPPIPWDVELAQWFDEHFPPLEKRRSYARPSRRQSATPDIPRPRYVLQEGALDSRTYAVVLDTSGSMSRETLAKALGAIASYSTSRDVGRVRVVFCDADAYDQGYMSPEDIAGRVKVKGRGGTVLQPGIDLLEKADDFPEEGPVLVITDGYCDRLHIRREHAYILPWGRSLPFVPRGKVFRIR